MGIDSKAWITAMAILNDAYWITGERTGRVCLWNTEGKYIRDLKVKLPGDDHYSQELNKFRVNCLSPGLNPHKLSFFAGFPTIFDEYNVIESRNVYSKKVHDNDWVYCIHPLTENHMLLVVAGVLQVWEKVSRNWRKEKDLIKEVDRERLKGHRNRSHISALLQLRSSPEHFGLGVFDGSVKVLDLQQERVIVKWKEHKEKIWAIENVSQGVFASSGADGMIKLWDVRSKRSVYTLDSHAGEEVCSLLQLNETLLVAGVCPKKRDSLKHKKADIVFYDIRR